MLIVLGWLLLLIGAFLVNILGMMELLPRFFTFPLFSLSSLYLFTLFRRRTPFDGDKQYTNRSSAVSAVL